MARNQNSIETLAKRHLHQPFDTWSNTILSFYLENKFWSESLSSVYHSSYFLFVLLKMFPFNLFHSKFNFNSIIFYFYFSNLCFIVYYLCCPF